MEPKPPIWGNSINQFGMYFSEPILHFWDDELERWYDKEGDSEITREGLEQTNYNVTKFSSYDKREVEIWMQGIRAAFDKLEALIDYDRFIRRKSKSVVK